MKADFWAIFDLGDAEPGDDAVAVATRQAGEFAAKWKARYPSAVACVTDDLASLTVHLRFPAEHWKRIRHLNFIEATFGETHRRVKVIGRLPGETSCLSLLCAVLNRSSRGWRGLTMTRRSGGSDQPGSLCSRLGRRSHRFSARWRAPSKSAPERTSTPRRLHSAISIGGATSVTMVSASCR